MILVRPLLVAGGNQISRRQMVPVQVWPGNGIAAQVWPARDGNGINITARWESGASWVQGAAVSSVHMNMDISKHPSQQVKE